MGCLMCHPPLNELSEHQFIRGQDLFNGCFLFLGVFDSCLGAFYVILPAASSNQGGLLSMPIDWDVKITS